MSMSYKRDHSALRSRGFRRGLSISGLALPARAPHAAPSVPLGPTFLPPLHHKVVEETVVWPGGHSHWCCRYFRGLSFLHHIQEELKSYRFLLSSFPRRVAWHNAGRLMKGNSHKQNTDCAHGYHEQEGHTDKNTQARRQSLQCYAHACCTRFEAQVSPLATDGTVGVPRDCS